MKEKINIIVTGAGSAVGQGILKSLCQRKSKLNLIPADISPLNAGLYFLKKFIIIPKVERKGSLTKIVSLIKKYKAKGLFVGSEYEIEFFSKNKDFIEKKTNTKIFISKLQNIKIGNDKYKTYLFLKKNNFLVPETFELEKKNKRKIIKKIKFPCYAKPKKGTSSRGIIVVKSLKEFKNLKLFNKKYIIQSHAGDTKNKEEYTAGLFVDKNKNIIGPIILHRILKNGTSWVTEVVQNKKISNYLRNVSRKFNSVGSINFQFYIKKGLPEIFEINPRISGTCPIRTYFGFNEPEMYLDHFLNDKKLKQPKIKMGMCLRFNQEVFIDNFNFKKAKNIKEQKVHAKIRQWF
jgi:carbamoyl-phosphate synthase large subunit